MTTVQLATDAILQRRINFATTEMPTVTAGGHVLAEDLIADRDFPPFERVTMDGIAIAWSAWEAGQRTFPVQETLAAGAPQGTLRDPQYCIEIMTGAVLPAGADTVIRYEDIEMNDGVATVAIAPKQGQNVHHQGEDRKAGSVIVPAGGLINGAVIGVAATVGRTHLQVLEPPRICVVSTGDELVPIDVSPLPHQIRRSNVHAIIALLRSTGAQCVGVHLLDDPDSIQGQLGNMLDQYHALVLSGGVSKGKFDYIPGALEAVGVEKHFHGVAQRPGKPFWFGTRGDGKAVFALPGNPVSSFVGTLRYVIPWLRASQGVAFPAEYATLTAPFSFAKPLTYFLQVSLTMSPDGQLLATPVPGRGSGDHANLVDAHGFLELPGDQDAFEPGQSFPVWRY
ncbi:MAG: molybdopterin molybdotransferase MoeA [Saprospiraceae bacterium]|nr:molybdopterin molybdotransferase MoeA [Saprospiraceae bacterium]